MNLEDRVNKLEDRVRELEKENKRLAVDLKNVEIETAKDLSQIMPNIYKSFEQFQENVLTAVSNVIKKNK
ncbi:hypothetical protein [Wukongibacter sp. M2B1]|uniref:hypothetical protein n=1 Tax=Wukongibacter sp. M2B1 TaxID=3088895 RepID=UPI003D7A7E39